MYWLGPGKQTTQRHRAVICYVIYGAAAIGACAALISVYGLTLSGLGSAVYSIGVLGGVGAYVIWRQRVEGPRSLFGAPREQMPSVMGANQMPNRWVGVRRSPSSIVPAVYRPVPHQPGYGVGPAEAAAYSPEPSVPPAQ